MRTGLKEIDFSIEDRVNVDLIRLNEKFRIYIVLPLLPGFDNVNAVQAVLYFIMRSITKGDSSLFKRLERAGKSIRKTITERRIILQNMFRYFTG